MPPRSARPCGAPLITIVKHEPRLRSTAGVCAPQPVHCSALLTLDSKKI
jgi:hypothetical protein